MDNDPRWKWAVFSGLTRREQHVLTFLIVAIAAGLAWEQYRGGWRREPLTLHRATVNGAPVAATSTTLAVLHGRQKNRATTATAELPLDLNKASAEQLETLPGIGPVLASAIVRWRETHGPFQRIEDLKQVPGIGERTLDAVRPCLKPLDVPTTPVATVINDRKAQMKGAKAPQSIAPAPPGAPARVDINIATIEELDTLDGIGPALARRIVEYRQQHGPFRTPADIQKVPGIGPSVFLKNRDRLIVGPPRR
jgi:competence protein ComEA